MGLRSEVAVCWAPGATLARRLLQYPTAEALSARAPEDGAPAFIPEPHLDEDQDVEDSTRPSVKQIPVSAKS